MLLFTEWLQNKNLNEGLAVGQSATPRLGFSPMRSALEKIVRASQKGYEPFSLDMSVLRSQLGLDAEEMQALKAANLFLPQGFLNQDSVVKAYKNLAKTAPNMIPKQNHVSPAPPPPPIK